MKEKYKMYQGYDFELESEISVSRGSRIYSKIYSNSIQEEMDEVGHISQKENEYGASALLHVSLFDSILVPEPNCTEEVNDKHPLYSQIMDIELLQNSIEQHSAKLKENIVSILNSVDAISTYKLLVYLFFNKYEYVLRFCRMSYPELAQLHLINKDLKGRICTLIKRFQLTIDLPQRNSILFDLEKLNQIVEKLDQEKEEVSDDAQIVIPGIGIYRIDKETARMLLCRDRYLGITRSNSSGAHPVKAYAGIHYKPNAGHEPITPGAELIVSTFGQLLAGHYLIMAPSILIKVSDVNMIRIYSPQENPAQDIHAYQKYSEHCYAGKSAESLFNDEPLLLQQLKTEPVVHGNTIQASLTIEGITLQYWLGATHTVMELHTLLGKELLCDFLEKVWDKQLLLEKLFLEYPQLANAPSIASIFEVWSGYMAMLEPQLRLTEFKDLDIIPPANRLHRFREIVSYENTDRLLMILAILKQYPQIISYRQSLDLKYLASMINYIDIIKTLYPNENTNDTVAAVLGHYDKVNLESYAYLSILGTIVVASDWKSDNIIVQIERDATQKIKEFYFVAIDNDKFTAQLYGRHSEGKTVNLRSILFCLSHLMVKPIPSSVIHRIVQHSAEVWLIDWLYALYYQNKAYSALRAYQHLQDGDQYKDGAKILDIPIELSTDLIRKIEKLLTRVIAIFNQADTSITMEQFLSKFNPLIHLIYKTVRDEQANPLEAMSIVYGHHGITLIKDIIHSDCSSLSDNELDMEHALTAISSDVELEKSISSWIQNNLFVEWGSYDPETQVVILERLFAYYPFASGIIKNHILSLPNLLFQVVRCARLHLLVSILNCYNHENLSQIQNVLGQNLLHEACQVYGYYPNQGAWEVIRFLVEYDNTLLKQQDNNGYTPIFGLARALKSSSQYEQMIGINYAKTQEQSTVETWHGVLLFFINHGIDINVVDEQGYTFMHHAGLNGVSTLVDALFAFKADPEIPLKITQFRVLHSAAREGHAEVVEVLLRNKTELFSKTAQEETVLHCACQYGHISVVKKLLSCLDSLDKQRLLEMPDKNDGKTALHYAAFCSNRKLLKLLLEVGANPMTRNSQGYTALHFAAKMGYIEHVYYLMQFSIGQSLHTFTSYKKETALQVAEKFKHDNIAFYLVNPKIGKPMVELHNHFSRVKFELFACQKVLSAHYKEWFDRDDPEAHYIKVAGYFMLGTIAKSTYDFHSAAEFYNSASVLANQYNLSAYQNYIDKRIADLPMLWRYRIDHRNYEIESNTYSNLKKELANIRLSALQKRSAETDCETKKILNELNEDLMKFISRMIVFSETGIPKLSPDLEKYKITWITLGALPLQTHNSMQPLQFAVLFAPDSPKEIIQYCQHWVDLFCLHLINIGETPCTVLLLKSPIDLGFSIYRREFYVQDLNMQQATSKLLATPLALAALQNNQEMGITFRYALRTAGYLHGSREIYTQYTKELDRQLRFIPFLGQGKNVRPEILWQTRDDLLQALTAFTDKYNKKRYFFQELDEFFRHALALFQQIIIALVTCFAFSPNEPLFELINKLRKNKLINSDTRDHLLILLDRFIQIQFDVYLFQKTGIEQAYIDEKQQVYEVLKVLLPFIQVVKDLLVKYGSTNTLDKHILYNANIMNDKIEFSIIGHEPKDLLQSKGESSSSSLKIT